MGFAHSPNTTTNGLVLIYDTGNRKSFKGEPTTNLITDTSNFGNTFWNQRSGTITANDAIGPRGIQNAAKIVATNTDPYIYSSAMVTASTGNNTWSIWVKGVGNTVGKSAQVRINFSGTATGTADTNASVNLTDHWQLLQTTANVTSGGTIKFGLEAPNGAVSGDIMYFADPMFEQKSHATQFIQGTRSADSGSLTDLTGNVELDVTNAGFDNTGYLTFDGSNDHITGVLPISGGGEPHTIELVLSPSINQSAFGSRRDPFTIGNASLHEYSALDVNTGNMNWYFYGRDTTFTNNPTLVAGNYYHMVLSYAGGFSNNSNKRVWINGIEQTLSSGHNETPLLPDNPQFSVGRDRGRNTAYFPGDIPIFRVYNRALTEKEALDNFNAIRRRFNI